MESLHGIKSQFVVENISPELLNDYKYDEDTPKRYLLYGICSGFFCGSAPKELEELTEIELSFISPSPIHGNIFTYFGGPKGIQGWNSLVQCDLKSIYRKLHGMERLSMPN
jgi:hypothetical protein